MDLEKAKKEIARMYGDETLFSLDLGIQPKVTDVISTTSLILDWTVLGVGGFPRGRVTELAGGEGVGKTTVALHTIAEAINRGFDVAYIDAENKLDFIYAEQLGIDLSKIMVAQPHNAEQALDIADALCKVPTVGLIVFDSAAALGSVEEQQKKYSENASFGATARLLNKFFRRSLANIRENNIAVIFTNQHRAKIGSLIPNQKITTGGFGLQYYSSVLMQMSRIGDIKDGDAKVAHKIKAWTTKNGVAVPKRVGEFKIWWGRGIDKASDTLDVAVEAGIIKKTGAFYRHEDELVGHGLVKAVATLNEDSVLRDRIREECIVWLKGQYQ